MSHEELAALLRFFRARAHTFAGGDHENAEMVAAAVVGVENVIAEAKAVGFRLPSELECMNRIRAARFKKIDRVAVALRLEESPHGANFQELRRFLLYALDVIEQ